MAILILGSVVVLLPTLLVFWLIWSKGLGRAEWLAKAIIVLNVGFLFFQIGPWAITSYYLRYVVLIFVVLGTAYAYSRRWRSLAASRSRSRRLMIAAAAMVGLVAVNIVATLGRLPPRDSIDLGFPLKGGTYYVLQGGTTWAANLFHSLVPKARYAVDIVQIDRFGNRAATIFPPLPLRDYHIYGAPLYSPCSGTVKAAVGTLPDNIPPATDFDHPGGNHVVIACQAVDVTLAHLQQDSLRVFIGDSVVSGQLIGWAGNSGYSDEPHLHMQANAADGRPLPLTFDGKFLSVNSVYRNGDIDPSKIRVAK